MTFGYNKYRICKRCGWLGALSNHGSRKGKVAGHANQNCPNEDVLFEDLPRVTEKQIRKHLNSKNSENLYLSGKRRS